MSDSRKELQELESTLLNIATDMSEGLKKLYEQ
jgi:hypothetical protein